MEQREAGGEVLHAGEYVVRIISKDRQHFRGTHKGAEILIERNRDIQDVHFYITVTWKDGCYMYNGYAPKGITTMREAKAEAIKGACLG